MTKLAVGTFKSSDESYEINRLHINQLPIIETLQNEVFQLVENKASLQMLTRPEFNRILSGNGYMVGVFTNEKLIAFRAMLYPPLDDPEHLGYDAGLPEEVFQHIIYSEISIVHPHYRGHGLQTKMGEIVMGLIDKNRFLYVAATVAPHNIPSMKDKFKLGMYIITLAEKYDGKSRYTFFNSFKDTIKKTETFDVLSTDLKTQQKLFLEGYIATGIFQSESSYYLAFSKNNH